MKEEQAMVTENEITQDAMQVPEIGRIRHPPLPALLCGHTPGWTVETDRRGGGVTLFQSDYEPLGLRFKAGLSWLMEGEPETRLHLYLSNDETMYWTLKTGHDVLEVASECEGLTAWLGDIARICDYMRMKYPDVKVLPEC